MVISSVIVKCLNGTENSLTAQLAEIEGVSVERVVDGDVILVLESPSVDSAAQTLEQKIVPLPGVAGAYPVYISMEA